MQGLGAGAGQGERPGGDTTGAGRRSGRIPPPHESETASATNRSAVESPRLHLASAAPAQATPDEQKLLSLHRVPGNEAPGATLRGEIANNCPRLLNDSFHLLKRLPQTDETLNFT